MRRPLQAPTVRHGLIATRRPTCIRSRPDVPERRIELEATAFVIRAVRIGCRVSVVGRPGAVLDVPVAADQIERAATNLRQQLGPGLDPIDRPLTTAERAGVIVVRDPHLGDRLTPTNSVAARQRVDAFSDIGGKRPIIVLTGAPGIPWDRDNYNVSHELGHVVLHTETRRGPKTVEDHAHRFAGAFLAPAVAIDDELPASIDWRDYYELKLKWGISIAALIRRAYDLGRIHRDDYVLVPCQATVRSDQRHWAPT